MKARLEKVNSKDGTMITYHVIGAGTEGLVLLSGANSSANHYIALARQLAQKYTVYLVERRGRNASGPQGDEYSLEKECEDVIAVLEVTKAEFIFGHSSGAIIAMKTALKYTNLKKLTLYEPPHQFDTDWIPKFEEQLAKEDYAGAEVTAIKGLQVSPKMNKIPSFVLKIMFKAYFKGERMQELIELTQSVPKEVRAMKQAESQITELSDINISSLLMIGGKSPKHLQDAGQTFYSILPNCRMKVFQEFDHSGPISGVEQVASTVMEFLNEG